MHANRSSNLFADPLVCRHHAIRVNHTEIRCKNVNPKIVREMLGHANISETMDAYSHVLPSMQEAAVSAMETTLTQHGG